MPEHVNPAEPTGLGAVVETDTGEVLIRYSVGSLAPWISQGGGSKPDRPYRYYTDHKITRVIFGGVYR
jgi:hypothetical protein